MYVRYIYQYQRIILDIRPHQSSYELRELGVPSRLPWVGPKLNQPLVVSGPIANGKRIAELLFTETGTYAQMNKCRCGKKRKQAGTNYQNFVSHVESAHPNYSELLSEDSATIQIHLNKNFEVSRDPNM